MSVEDHFINNGHIRDIVIAGGGIEGWMSSAFLARVLAPQKIRITHIELPTVREIIPSAGIFGVSQPYIQEFLVKFGISEPEIMQKSRASFRLGSKYSGGPDDQPFMQFFGEYGHGKGVAAFHQYWLKQYLSGDDTALETYAMGAELAQQDKFIHPVNDEKSILSTFDYAYHFDPEKFTDCMREIALKAGVINICGDLDNVRICRTSGMIEALVLAGGRAVSGDFFIDCTGVEARLIGKALGIDFESWANMLPCNRAIFGKNKTVSGSLSPYTHYRRHPNGFLWNIPLQTHTEEGVFFASNYLSADKAEALLTGHNSMSHIQSLKIQPGRHHCFWRRNCLAIGLSAGFSGPINSTALHLVQSGLRRFVSLLPYRGPARCEADEYNRMMIAEMEQIRYFSILHYVAQRNKDSALWRLCGKIDIPDSLQLRIDQFKSRGRLVLNDEDPFDKDSWLALFVGMGILPDRYDPLLGAIDEATIARHMQAIRTEMQKTTAKVPTHYDYLKGYGAMARDI